MNDYKERLSKEKLRTISCSECKHKTAINQAKQQVFCDIFDNYVPKNTSEYCNDYQPYLDKSERLVRGYKIKQYQIKEYLTENQWLKKGYKVKKEAKGTLMYASEVSAKKYPDSLLTYYTKEEVE